MYLNVLYRVVFDSTIFCLQISLEVTRRSRSQQIMDNWIYLLCNYRAQQPWMIERNVLRRNKIVPVPWNQLSQLLQNGTHNYCDDLVAVVASGSPTQGTSVSFKHNYVQQPSFRRITRWQFLLFVLCKDFDVCFVRCWGNKCSYCYYVSGCK